MDPFRLRGKAILVSGASSGIGRGVSVYLDALGARLALSGRNEGRLDAVAAALEGTGHQTFPMDLSVIGMIPDWAKQVVQAMGPLSGVVHCAGIRTIRPVRSLASSDLDREFQINVHAGLSLVRAFRPKAMRESEASFVLLSSVMGMVGAPANALYSASKGAVLAMARSLALELAPEGIRVNVVSPGFVHGEMLDAMKGMVPPEQLERVEALHPLGFGNAEDVAGAVAFLLGATGRWITGSNLVVDGGYTAQ